MLAFDLTHIFCIFHQGWVHESIEGCFVSRIDPLLSSMSIYKLSVTCTTQVYISVVQPKKRSNTQTKYWYCDTSMILLRGKNDPDDPLECMACSLNGVARQSHMEVFLEAGDIYYLMPWSCTLASMPIPYNSSDATAVDRKHHWFALTTYSGSDVAIDLLSDTSFRCNSCHYWNPRS